MYFHLIAGHRSQLVVLPLLLLPTFPHDPWPLDSDDDDDDDEFDLGALVIKCSHQVEGKSFLPCPCGCADKGVGKRRRKDEGLVSLFAVAITPSAILWINFLIFADQTTILFLIQQPKFVCLCVLGWLVNVRV